MKKFSLILLLLTSFMFSQERPKFNFGSETDLVPFLTGGYYSSLWVSYDNFKLRSVLANVNMPDFLIPDGFDEYEVKANAIIIDYFFNEDLTGHWLALGVEFWNNRARNESNLVSEKFNSTIFTFGTGYVYYFYGNLYVNPWIAVHYNNSDNNSLIGGLKFEEKEWTPEFSVKFGFAV